MNDYISEGNYNYLLKFIIIGDAAVGKSNLLVRYTSGQFKEEYQLTIGVEFGSNNVIIGDNTYRIQIWDTAGQENFRSITRSYYKNTACAIIVYEISNKKSFENISSWIEECKNTAPKSILMVLVGNKCDLDNREVTEEEGREFAEKNGMLFFETSAKTGKNVEELFKQSVKVIDQKIKENYYDLENDSCGIKKGNEEINVVLETNLENDKKHAVNRNFNINCECL